MRFGPAVPARKLRENREVTHLCSDRVTHAKNRPCPRARDETGGFIGAERAQGLCIPPTFIFVMRASGSLGLIHSWLDPFFFRFRSSRANCSRVGFSIPAASASSFRYSL